MLDLLIFVDGTNPIIGNQLVPVVGYESGRETFDFWMLIQP
jgi:hypothetical protein